MSMNNISNLLGGKKKNQSKFCSNANHTKNIFPPINFPCYLLSFLKSSGKSLQILHYKPLILHFHERRHLALLETFCLPLYSQLSLQQLLLFWLQKPNLLIDSRPALFYDRYLKNQTIDLWQVTTDYFRNTIYRKELRNDWTDEITKCKR